MSIRLGVMGGMFDPVHHGHIAIARHALSTLRLDRLKLIPCNQPNHRSAAIESARHRIAMLELATADDSRIEIDDCEIQRSGTSYTVDTLLQLRTGENIAHLVLVLGMDAMNTLTSWHRWPEILDLSHLAVMARNGQELGSETAHRTGWSERLASSPEELFSEAAGGVFLSPETDYMETSRAIRQALKAGSDLTAMVSGEVLAYISKHKLYAQAK